MMQISSSTARAVENLVNEMLLLDTRAGCSDRFFRQRFMLLAKTMRDTGALEELRQGVELMEHHPPDAEDAQPPEDTPQEKRKRARQQEPEPTEA